MLPRALRPRAKRLTKTTVVIQANNPLQAGSVESFEIWFIGSSLACTSGCDMQGDGAAPSRKGGLSEQPHEICLPDVSGLDLFDELRGDYPALPLLALSALDDPRTVKAVLAKGALGYVPKSSSHPVMVNALRLVLSGGRYLPPEIIADDWVSLAGRGTSLGTRAAASVEDFGLTERQRQVLALMAQGKSNKLICRELGLAEATVKIHVTAVLRALKVTSRTQAVVLINRLGLRVDGLDGRFAGERPFGIGAATQSESWHPG